MSSVSLAFCLAFKFVHDMLLILMEEIYQSIPLWLTHVCLLGIVFFVCAFLKPC